MKRAVVFAFIACWVVSALSLAEDGRDSKPSATVSPAGQFETSAKPSPKPTTHKPTTPKPTTHKPTTPKPTTHKPTTPKPTTHKPTTPKPTTHKPTTPKPTTHKPTTPKPTTHKPTPPKPTTHKPTTPAPPKPTPPTTQTKGNYTLMADTKVMCLMAQMALQIRLDKPKDNGTFIVQPNMTKVQGGCQGTKANLTLVFKEGFITFMFNKSVANNSVYVDALSFKLTYPLSKEGKNEPHTASNKSMHLFNAKIGYCYSCKSDSIYMGNGLYLDVSQDTMQAFNLTKGNEFGKIEQCPADQPDYRVAIAVGVTLLVLIVVVVVAYLLGRKRRADGYQSL
ncbi:macrosialin isoform X2 [Centropristis striata]|uniref:macrosialin isoform X2 n=1 Tax=Centropristis striata TaxID=184440 RepID=UPI0027E179D7|nr:macrosialin isoform X2 [Centropristis striata]